MQSVEEKLAKSLTAESIELIPHLPYLLQDLWELGSSPKDMLDMITKHINVSEQTRVLDLACGKGAVSVQLAKKLGCTVKGIDIIPEFIDFAVNKAQEFGVGELCQFVVGDITESVKVEKDYDIVILGAVGDVLGTPEETIGKLKDTIKPEGYIFIDDAYGREGTNKDYYTREEWLLIFDKTQVRLIDEKIIEDDQLENLNREQQGFIVKRANELKKQYPEKSHLFYSYIHSQQAECDELENDISGVTLLLQNNFGTKMPVALFNGTVATTNGLYSIKDIDVNTAKKYIEQNGFLSAIGHEATADVMADLFGQDIKMNRVQFHQQVGQYAIAFKLNIRPPEGDVLTREEIEKIGYSLKLMERLE